MSRLEQASLNKSYQKSINKLKTSMLFKGMFKENSENESDRNQVLSARINQPNYEFREINQINNENSTNSYNYDEKSQYSKDKLRDSLDFLISRMIPLSPQSYNKNINNSFSNSINPKISERINYENLSLKDKMILIKSDISKIINIIYLDNSVNEMSKAEHHNDFPNRELLLAKYNSITLNLLNKVSLYFYYIIQ